MPDGVSPSDVPQMSDAGREQLMDAYLDQQLRLQARGEWLESSAAAQQRLTSRVAYRELSDADAIALFRQLWGAELVPPLPDADSLVGEDRIDAFLDDRSMRIEGLDGRKDRLVISDVPLRAPDESGEASPTDVDLVRDSGGFVPENSVADIEIPAEVEDGARVDRVTVTPAGSATGAQVDGDTVVYPNAERDTDVALVSTLTGIETFHQLRSDLAPEELRLDLTVPAKARLEAADNGGLVVVNDAGTVASVSPVTAVDAQGEPVAAALRADGSTAVIDIEHRGKDLAYPILVDPFVEEDWARNGTTNTTGTWYHQNAAALAGINHWGNNYSSNVSAGLYAPRAACYAPVAYSCYSANHNGSSWDGLHMMVRASTFYPANSWAQWYYNVPGYSTRINRVDWGAMHLRPGSTQANPYFFYGIWSRPQNGYVAYRTFANATAGGAVNNITHDWHAQFAGTHAGPHALVVGWFTPVNTTPSAWRDGYIGGMVVQLTDPDQPSNLTVDRTGPTDWTNGASFTAAPEARDAGVGMKSFTLRVPSTDSSGTQVQTRTHPCTGRRGSECPSYDYRTPPAAASRSWKLPDSTIAGTNGTAFTYSVADANPARDGAQPMPEGINTVTLEARDIIHGDHTSTNTTWQVKVDRTGPVGSITGLSEGQLLLNESYSLSASAADAHAGVAQVSLRLDGQQRAANTSCPATGECSVSWSMDGSDTGLADGEHVLELVSTDRVGNVASTTKRVFVDRTAPNVNTAGGLEPSEGWLGGDKHPLRILAKDDKPSAAPASGAAYTALLVDGPPIYESSNPSCVDSTCTVDGIAWADVSSLTFGEHAVSMIVRDRAGNTSTKSWTIKVDNRAPALAISGTLGDSEVLSASENLHVDTTDGDVIEPESEPVAISVEVDGVEVSRVDRDTSECVLPGCSVSHDFSLAASTLTTGQHEVTVEVLDAAANSNVQSWTINVPAHLAGAVCPTYAAAAPGPAVDGARLVSPADATTQLQQEAAALIAPSTPLVSGEWEVDPTVQLRPESVASAGTPAPAEAASSLGDGISVGDPSEPICIAPANVAPNASVPTVVGGDAALVANTQEGVDTLLRPTAAGLETFLQIRDDTAPENYAWKVTLQDGQSLQQVAPDLVAIVEGPPSTPETLDDPEGDLPPPPDGPDTDIDDDWYGDDYGADSAVYDQPLGDSSAAEQRDAAGDSETQLKRAAEAIDRAEEYTSQQVVGVITAPWATDAADSAVPIELGVSGQHVTIQVDHTGAVFPVVADPVYASAAAVQSSPVTAAGIDWRDCPVNNSPCGFYDWYKAVKYVRKYAVKFNKGWPNYAPNDCANFASQALYAGGMNMMREWEKGHGSWWAKPGNHGDSTKVSTESWRLAHVLKTHLIEYGLIIGTVKWRVGDIVFFDWHNGGAPTDHVALVTKVTNKNVFIGGHGGRVGSSHNYAEKSWEKVKESLKNKTWSFRRYTPIATKANVK